MMTVSYLPDPPYRDDDVLLGHEIDDLLLSLRGVGLDGRREAKVAETGDAPGPTTSGG